MLAYGVMWFIRAFIIVSVGYLVYAAITMGNS